MFTGIVEEQGIVEAVHPISLGRQFTIRGQRVMDDLTVEDSIAINGVCLTAIRVEGGRFQVEAVEETLTRSTLGKLRAGSAVNLERALRVGGRLGGHWVAGHVDGTGRILSIKKRGAAQLYDIELPDNLERYTIEKGSIAVDGISLTIAALNKNRVTISVIPYTLENTNLPDKHAGDLVNIEVDMLGKYVESLLNRNGKQGKMSEAWLRSLGY